MLLYELLNEERLEEDVTETKDLMAIADYLSQWMADKNAKIDYERIPMPLKSIERAFGRPLPRVQSKLVNFMLYYPHPSKNRDALRIAFNDPTDMDANEAGAFFPDDWSINIQADKILKANRSVASVTLHELQHALDDYKSNGKILTAKAYSAPNDNHAAYMSHPAEINARFSQALWMLASGYESIARTDVYPAIDAVLNRYKLSAEYISDPKEHKRLVTRAYKFLDDVMQVVNGPSKPVDKPTFVQTIKNLIRKWLPK